LSIRSTRPTRRSPRRHQGRSSVCSDDYFATVRAQFDRFVDPLVYTAGDNEWTDCHRPNNGGYDPLERLQAVRNVFFPNPGKTLGEHSIAVQSQAGRGLPENVSYRRAGVAFAALHVVGSNNSLAPWTGQTVPGADHRGAAAEPLDLINKTFDSARGPSPVDPKVLSWTKVPFTAASAPPQ
jgi:hypothetical protein